MARQRRQQDNRAAVRSASKTGQYTVLAAAVTGFFGLVTTILLLVVHPGQPAPAASTTSPAQVPSGRPGQQLGTGALFLSSDGTGYDLDAVTSGFTPLTGHSWVTQNIKYDPQGNNGKPVISVAHSPNTDVAMGMRGGWTYQDCASAPYGRNTSLTGPNVIAGPSLRQGEGVCVETKDEPGLKADGGHYVLLVIKSITAAGVQVDVTVWYGGTP